MRKSLCAPSPHQPTHTHTHTNTHTHPSRCNQNAGCAQVNCHMRSAALSSLPPSLYCRSRLLITHVSMTIIHNYEKQPQQERESERERERVGFLTKCEASGYARPFPGAMGTNYSCQMNLSFGEPSMFKADGALCAASRPVCWLCAAPLRNTIRECALLTANATSPGPPPHTTYKHLNSVSNISERSRSFFRSQI